MVFKSNSKDDPNYRCKRCKLIEDLKSRQFWSAEGLE